MNDNNSSLRVEVKFRLNRDEVEVIDQIAKRLNMTRNDLMTHMVKRVQGQTPKMNTAISRLSEINRDMGRAGQLLKMWLVDDPMTKDFRVGTVLSILQRISELKDDMKSLTLALRMAYERKEILDKNALSRKSRMSVKFRLASTEAIRLTTMAQSVGMSRNEFLSRLMTFRHIPSQSDIALLRLLFVINGDLGRVGGLYKMWLADSKSLFLFNTAMIQQHLSALEAARENLRVLMKTVKKNCCIN